MGKLVYADADIVIDIDDRTLAHLQIVIGSKLRRHESFFFSWTEPQSGGGGRSSVWLNAAIPLYFTYAGGRTPAINRAWILELSTAANSGAGLLFSPEPNAPAGSTVPIHGYV